MPQQKPHRPGALEPSATPELVRESQTEIRRFAADISKFQAMASLTGEDHHLD